MLLLGEEGVLLVMQSRKAGNLCVNRLAAASGANVHHILYIVTVVLFIFYNL